MFLQRPASAAPLACPPTTASGQILEGEGGTDHAHHNRSGHDRRASYTPGTAPAATRAPNKTPTHSLDSMDGGCHDSGADRRSRHVVCRTRSWPHHSRTSCRLAGLPAAVLGGRRTRKDATGRGIPRRVGAGGSAGLLAALHACSGCRGPNREPCAGGHIPRLLAALCGDGSDCRSADAGVLAALCGDDSDHDSTAAGVLAHVLSPHGCGNSVGDRPAAGRGAGSASDGARAEPRDRLQTSRRPRRRVSLLYMAESNRRNEPLSSEQMIEQFRAGYDAPQSLDAEPEPPQVPQAEFVATAVPDRAPLPPAGPTPRPSDESRRRAAVSFAIALFVLGLGIAIALAGGN